jgi:hypothetical protein
LAYYGGVNGIVLWWVDNRTAGGSRLSLFGSLIPRFRWGFSEEQFHVPQEAVRNCFPRCGDLIRVLEKILHSTRY